MPAPSTVAHIEGERRLREAVKAALAGIWRDLPGYDRADLEEWLARSLPVVEAGQRASVALTCAYLARFLGEPPIAVDTEALIGAAVRNGTPPATVYERPFITVWTSLKNSGDEQAAIDAGLAHAQGSAAMDIQLSMRETLRAVANG